MDNSFDAANGEIETQAIFKYKEKGIERPHFSLCSEASMSMMQEIFRGQKAHPIYVNKCGDVTDIDKKEWNKDKWPMLGK